MPPNKLHDWQTMFETKNGMSYTIVRCSVCKTELSGTNHDQPCITEEVANDKAILVESIIAQAQSVMQEALHKSGLSREELAKKLHVPEHVLRQALIEGYNVRLDFFAEWLLACDHEVHFQLSHLSKRNAPYPAPYPGTTEAVKHVDEATAVFRSVPTFVDENTPIPRPFMKADGSLCTNVCDDPGVCITQGCQK